MDIQQLIQQLLGAATSQQQIPGTAPAATQPLLTDMASMYQNAGGLAPQVNTIANFQSPQQLASMAEQSGLNKLNASAVKEQPNQVDPIRDALEAEMIGPTDRAKFWGDIDQMTGQQVTPKVPDAPISTENRASTSPPPVNAGGLSPEQKIEQGKNALMGDPTLDAQTPEQVRTFLSTMLGISPQQQPNETSGGAFARNILGVINSPAADILRRFARSASAYNAGAPAQVGYLSQRQHEDSRVNDQAGNDARWGGRFEKEQQAANKRAYGTTMLQAGLEAPFKEAQANHQRMLEEKGAAQTETAKGGLALDRQKEARLGREGRGKMRASRLKAGTEGVARTEKLQAETEAIKNMPTEAKVELDNLTRIYTAMLRNTFEEDVQARIQAEWDQKKQEIFQKYQQGAQQTSGGAPQQIGRFKVTVH